MAVVDRGSRLINLSHQEGALSSTVLDQLRKALNRDGHFTQLSVAGNPLDDECIAVLCALFKDRTAINSIDFENCDLNNKTLGFYLIPALLVRKRMMKLNLSRNTSITEGSAAALVRLIREGQVTELRLMGTNLGRAGGKMILEAIEDTYTIEVCQLPFNVGYETLDRVAFLLQRNVNSRGRGVHFDELEEQCLNAGHDQRSPSPVLMMGPRPMGTAEQLPAVAKPLLGTSREATALGSLEKVTLKDWVDPAVSRSLAHLHVLRSRCDLYTRHRSQNVAKRRRLIGLDRGQPTLPQIGK